MVGKVTTLEHELRDDTVETRALVTETLLASAQGTEVGGGLGDDVVVQLEGDTTGRSAVDGDVEEAVTTKTYVRSGVRLQKGAEGLTTCW